VREIRRERIPSTDSRLRRHIHHDSMSRRYPIQPRLRTPASVRWPRRVSVLDQGTLGSCTGNAGVGCMGTDPFFATVDDTDKWHHLNEADAVALYSAATSADPYGGEYPPDDTGSDGLTIAKVLNAMGMISGYRHAFSVADALDALQVGPVITGVNWYQDMFTPAPDGTVAITGALAGGHEFVVDEYDAVRGAVGCTNSWGIGWGVAGRFWIRVHDWANLLNQQGDVTAFVPSTEPPPVPIPDSGPDATFAAALRPWVTQRHIDGNARIARAARAWLSAKVL
jgi:hypothetical protein